DAVALDSLSATTSWSTAGAQSLEALVTDANGCAQASVVDLDVLAPPTIEAGPDIVLCNQPIPEQLTGFSPGFSTGGTGGFYGVDGVADAVTSDGWFDPASSGEGTFEVVYEFMSATTGCSNRDTLLVQVVAPTVAEAGPNVTVCINAPALQLSDFNPASGGSWAGLTGEANTAIIDAANGILNPQALSAGSHTFEITFGTGTCFSSDQMTVLIDPLPEITLASDDAFCANAGIVSVTEATPAGGIWDGGGVSTDGMFDVSQGAGIYALEYAYTDPTTLCSDTAVHEVEVLELPAVNAGLDISFCNQPIPAQLTGFSPGLTEGGDGMFYGLEEAVSAVSVEGLFDPSASGQGTFEVVYEFTSDVTGCMHNDTLVVEVTAPIAITAGVDTTVCINAPLLQLEGFLPLIGVTWSGVSPDAQNALVDAANGLVNPQLLPAGSHLFELSVGAGTCLSTDQRAVFVQSLPVITLASSSEFCGYEAVEPLATPSPNGGLWLGTGLDDASLGLFDTDQPAGAYALSYTYTDPLTLCADTVAYDVVIHPVPVAGFAAPTLACINLPWDITQTTSGGDDAVWEFGNTENSTEWEPDYTFPSIGVFDVEMVASNAQGCLDTTGVQVEITAPPVASFQVSTDNGCAPLDVSFTNDSYAPFATFNWEVNGEFFADEESPVQTFLEGPDVLVYDVLLTVSNLCGSSSEPQQITVLPQPQLGFALLEDTVCSPYIAEILNTSLGNPDVLQWDFGNGQTDVGGSPLWPTYVVDDEPVLFEIQLTGSNACGSGAFNTTILVQPNTTQAFFDLSVESGCAPLEVTVADLSVDATQFTFDFDNGFTSLDSLATSVFEDAGEYTITQYITNGCSFDTTSVTIEVFAEPVFSMSSDSPAYCEGEEGVFLVETAGSETVDWEFGQGDLGVGVEVSQAWDEEGAYWVVATVATALYACIASDSILVEIHATPVLDVSADFTSGCAPLAVSFSNASEDADFWLWDFADNSSDGILFELDHTFPNDGTEIAYYNVEVTGSTVQSCETSETIQIAVFPLPEIIFTLDASSGCGDPSTVQVLNASPGQLDFMWYLDDILGGTSFGPSIDVGGLGMHTITMQATNTYGCQLSQDQPFEVFANPLPALSLDPMSGCVPLELFVDDQSTGAATSTLFVGLNGGLVYEGPVPVDPMILNQVGSHTVGLEVVSADGCVQQLELEETVEVWPVPQVSFYADPYAGTSTNPDPLNSAWNFENESTDGLSSVWDFGDGGFSSEWDTYHTYSHSGIYPVTLTVYNGYGCFRDFTQVIEVLENLQVFVPTAFTPPSGGYADGVNDGWRPEISDASLVDQYDLWIYNRWGQLVWHSQDPEAYWIGEAQNDGDYFAVNDVYTW
ncbi:MAG: PKD domain-containing protein, partial [Flavobacteriales bacterium]|nr:PKD domain-containing protein [Flavobacteriales bacterium]